ncbi:MAG: bifunctional UDP-N-acetylglucosamine pyrophosphorylase/glucosamine-1-phosphate N-acetyltransferase [Candidatus Krumholzibacteriia bacterium]|jgi:bifunctional UDP-N-acetylglucosamine pyrophosphorylase/glucosamine-1-phosphate N-acetyltransferase
MNENSITIDAVVLAAGKGTRMNSDLPKVLHEISGKPLLGHVLDTVKAAGIDHTVVVVGHKADLVKETCGENGLVYVLQEPQLGTGHAVQMAVPALREGGYCVVLAGDVPLLKVSTLEKLVEKSVSSGAAAVVLTCVVEDAGAYGRIIKNESGQVQKIVEARDASPDELAVGEYNTGVFCFRSDQMIEALSGLTTDNQQGEYYLTDTVAYLVDKGRHVAAVVTKDPDEVVGINTIPELSAAEKILQRRQG